MKMENIQTPYFDISINPKNFDHDVMALLSELRPLWRQDDVESKLYSEGKMNTMKRYHVRTDAELVDAIVVRVYGDGMDGIVNRDKEILTMQVAHASGCFRPILAIFKNGVAYQHARGRTLTAAELNDPNIIRTASSKLARFTMMDLDKFPLVDSQGNLCAYDKTDGFEMMVQGLLYQYPDELKDARKNEIYQKHKLAKIELASEFDEYLAVKRSLDFKLRLAHGDFHIKNMIYDENSGDVCFCDYELSQFRPGIADLHYLLTGRRFLQQLGIYDPEAPEITEESRKLWIRSFVESQQQCLGRDPADLPEELFDYFELEIQFFDIQHNLFFMVFIGSMEETGVFPIELISLLPHCREKYDLLKPRLHSLATQIKELKEQCNQYL